MADSASAVQADIAELIPDLRGFARRFCRTSSDIDDLVQETLLRALANTDKFTPGTKLRSWLFTIMRNTYCTMYQRTKREQLCDENAIGQLASLSAPQEWSQQAREFEKAYADLPDHYRGAFKAVVLDGASYEAVSQRYDCPIGTIKSRVSRARTSLVERLS